jgi:endonuclease/exonuclease/phosphatase (EEP) superfamily protein YafD
VVLVGPIGIFFVLASRVKWWRRAVVTLLLIALWLPSLLKEQPNLFSSSKVTENTDSFSVMTYNVMAYKLSEKRVLETISNEAPDILCLVEGTFGTWAPDAVVKELGPNYHWAVGKRLSIASRFPIIKEEQILEKRDVVAFKVLLDINGSEVSVINLDISPPSRRSDVTAYDLLKTELNKTAGATILTGDFNTPRGSYHLERLTNGWNDCFAQTSEQRFLATWPTVPFPLWQIDHLFCNNQITPLSTRSIQSLGSDHRPIVGTFSTPGPEQSVMVSKAKDR